MEDEIRRRWFITPAERGNVFTAIDRDKPEGEAWTTGNYAEALIDGANYFRKLYEELCKLKKGDWVHVTDWRGDPDERLAGPGTEIAKVLADLARRGVVVKGLMWRSHPETTHFSEEENFHLAQRVNEAGGEILLDERVRRAGSHHQKLFLLRCPEDSARDNAFVGGIDLCHSRNDDAAHRGDPQAYELDDVYGDTPAWHDAQLHVRGPAVNDLALTFRERWEDPTPLDHRNPWRKIMARRSHEPKRPGPLPPLPDKPPAAGPHAVQVLRTYPFKRRPYPFAPRGERSIARAYEKAYARARRLIYVEDQYFWSAEIAELLAHRLRESPDLHFIAVVPRYFEEEGLVASAAPHYGQSRAIEILKEGGGDRVGFYDLENEEGMPIYVHAKVCIVDDVWAEIGSDNVNLRSWTHDSELSCTVLDETRDPREPQDPAGLGDGARVFARDLRLRLWREHLQTNEDEELIDPVEAIERWRSAAHSLEDWHRKGRQGPRPKGRIRPHDPGPPKPWADRMGAVMLRYFVDPDGRPKDLRAARKF